MKKVLAGFFATLLVVLSLTGCGSKAQEIGKWVAVGGEESGNVISEEDIKALGDVYIEFREDGKGTMQMEEKIDFSWKDNKITVVDDGVEDSVTYEIKGDELSLKMPDNLTIKYKKQ